MPIFALANTGIVIAADWAQHLMVANGLGIILGLSVGKPVGITLACIVAVAVGVCRLPRNAFGVMQKAQYLYAFRHAA